MATKTWNGSNDTFNNPNDWSPTGVPVSGDTAVINAGTVSFSGTLSGVAIQLTQAAGSTTSTGLSLTNATLDATASLTVTNNNSYNLTAPTITVAGTVTLAGIESFNGSKIAFTLSSGSTLVNSGTMTFNASSLVTNGTGTLQNSGTLSIQNPSNTTQAPVIATGVTGTGTVAMGQYSRVEISATVGSGQTFALSGGTSGNHIIQLDQANNFGASIQDFSASDLIAVISTSSYTGFQYAGTGTGSGTLRLFSGTTQIGAVAFSGANYQASDFQVISNDLGGGLYNVQVRTTGATGTAPGGGGSGTGGGGTGSTTVGAVYRFFDTRFGTHFFTSDANERNVVNATRSDLKQETNGFGDVAQTDPNATAVYRFFDKNFGTHFFTANTGERDTVIATRPDLTYEASSTFYEHSTQQSGDVAVYRLFDTKTGTQFLTGDQGEYNGLVTAGSSTYRSDLRSEGVAFYAPTGTFT